MATMSPPGSGVKIRAFRHGFGDCFLLAFPTSQANVAYYVLIDCGLFWAYTDGSAQLERVATEIEQATGGEVDLLIVTHEHYDHLAGFHKKDAFEIFEEKIAYGELWMAWTEDPADDFADELREEIEQGLRALRGLPLPPAVERLLEFSKNTDTARRNVLSLFDEDRIRYLSPGRDLANEQSPILPLGEGGPRFYVLGPPKDRPLLRTDFEADEVYGHLRLAVERSILAAAGARAGHRNDSELPFARGIGLDADEARDFVTKGSTLGRDHYPFQERYGFDDDGEQPREQTIEQGPPWRRIDDTWLQSLEELALQYDKYVNNTSLVLAIELPQTDRVLLFPGDAQVGNWLSWTETEIGFDRPDDGATVTSRELVERTVFYKVSHHGSHNATLEEKGLERMTSDELVAFIPTDEKWAWQRQGWRMPHMPVYRALLRKTQGRLIQADVGLPDEKRKTANKMPIEEGERAYSDHEFNEMAAEAEALQSTIDAFSQTLTVADLFWELEISD